jgi:hypothetical protein
MQYNSPKARWRSGAFAMRKCRVYAEKYECVRWAETPWGSEVYSDCVMFRSDKITVKNHVRKNTGRRLAHQFKRKHTWWR